MEVGLLDNLCFVTEFYHAQLSRTISLRILHMDLSKSVGNLECKESFLCALLIDLLKISISPKAQYTKEIGIV